MPDELQFTPETIQITKDVEVAQVALSGEQLSAALLVAIKASYAIDDDVTLRLPDYLRDQGLLVGVVRDVS